MGRFRSVLCASWVLLGAASAQEPAAPGFAVFDVSDLVRRGSAPTRAPVLPPLATALAGRHAGSDLNPNEVSAVDADLLASALLAGGGTLKIESTDERLWAFGPAAELKAAEARLAALRASFGETATVRVALVKRAPTKSVLTAAEAAAFLAAEPPHFTAAAVGPVDRAFVLRAGRDLSFISDYSVEVAQKASIANPTMTRLALGLNATAAAYALPDGRLLVRAGGVYTTLAGEPRTFPAGDPSRFGDLHLPEATTSGMLGGAVVESGGAFVAGGGPEGGTWIVQAVRSGGAGDAVVGFTGLLKHGFGLPALSSGRQDDPLNAVFGNDGGDDGAAIEAERLLPLLRGRLGADVGDGLTMTQSGRLLSAGNAAALAATRSFGAELTDRLLRNASCEFRYGVVDAAAAEKLMRGEVDAAKLPEGKLTATVPAGERVRLIACVERSYVATTEAEIAQECTIADPTVLAAFRGVAFDGVLDRMPDGAVVVSGRFFRRDDRGAFTAGPRLPGGSQIEIPTDDLVDLVATARTSGADYRLFGAAAVAGGVFVVLVRGVE